MLAGMVQRFWQIRRRRRQAAAARRITTCPPRFLDFGPCLIRQHKDARYMVPFNLKSVSIHSRWCNMLGISRSKMTTISQQSKFKTEETFICLCSELTWILTHWWPSTFLFFKILLIRDMEVERWNRQFGCETIHPTQKFISMNLFQMSCVITWAWSFLTSEVVEAVRGQKHHISAHTLAL